jgi:predicted signal transduction protein with EAL and GGDEF domain
VIGASICIALAPESGTDPEVLLRNADLALYRAKEDGRNCARVFESTMDDAARERRTLEYDLRRALARGEFELQYQPIVALERDDIVSVEALLRWRHPKRGLLSPAAFLKVAEDMGLMVPLGEWLLRRAFRDAMTWPEHVKIAVNLSPSQFKDRNLVDLVTEALSQAGLPPRRVEIDVTEGVLIGETSNVETLQRLRDIGVALALDDFGAGASSFSDLRAFRFDKIKIDGSFVLDVLKRPDCAAIVAAVSSLGRTLAVTVVAESVETEEQLDLLRELGCTQAQGYLFSPPRPVDEIVPMLLPAATAPSLADA